MIFFLIWRNIPVVSAPVVDASAVVCPSVVGSCVGWLVVDATSVVSTISPVVDTITPVVDNLVVNSLMVVVISLVTADVAADVVTVDRTVVNSSIVVVSSFTVVGRIVVVTDPKYKMDLYTV